MFKDYLFQLKIAKRNWIYWLECLEIWMRL